MPNKSFFNLPEEKRQKIINGAFKEFSENTYDKASIFEIAKNADVSRTSIYFYFKDKLDVYQYLINLIMVPHLKQIKEGQQEYPLFYLAKNLFKFFLEFYNTEYHNFVVNLFINMNPFNIRYFTHNLSQDCIQVPCGIIINKEKIDVKNEEDINIISFTIMSNMAVCVSEYFSNQKTKEQAESHFYRTLEIIENGVIKKGE